jgi:hypothetical protein
LGWRPSFDPVKQSEVVNAEMSLRLTAAFVKDDALASTAAELSRKADSVIFARSFEDANSSVKQFRIAQAATTDRARAVLNELD